MRQLLQAAALLYHVGCHNLQRQHQLKWWGYSMQFHTSDDCLLMPLMLRCKLLVYIRIVLVLTLSVVAVLFYHQYQGLHA